MQPFQQLSNNNSRLSQSFYGDLNTSVISKEEILAREHRSKRYVMLKEKYGNAMKRNKVVDKENKRPAWSG